MSAPGQPTPALIDLTEQPKSRPHTARASLSRLSSQLVDLTIPQDHMHTVAELLRPRAINLTETPPDARKKRKLEIANSPSRRRKLHSFQLQNNSADREQQMSPVLRGPLWQEPSQISRRISASPSPLSPHLQPGPTIFNLQNNTKPRKKAFKPFPFMDFPPEIRNNVYRMLLTTPTGPIELPELTGRNGAAHRARWAKCITAKQKRQHKTIFLETLECSKQVHDEASGILYGCNVFKYRSNPGEGTKQVVLPTRHLQLLKHIKISVISRESSVYQMSQDESVGDLVKQFAKDGLKLETFEITWFGNKRYHLRKDSLVCQALQMLNVKKHFAVKIAGEARMEKAMKEELERVLSSRKVEIHRPVKAVTGEELSDGEEM